MLQHELVFGEVGKDIPSQLFDRFLNRTTVLESTVGEMNLFISHNWRKIRWCGKDRSESTKREEKKDKDRIIRNVCISEREVEVFPIKELSSSLLELENQSRCMSWTPREISFKKGVSCCQCGLVTSKMVQRENATRLVL